MMHGTFVKNPCPSSITPQYSELAFDIQAFAYLYIILHLNIVSTASKEAVHNQPEANIH